MLNISKYHKLIVGCSAIATASVGGFVQSAEAAGTYSQAAQSSPRTTLIADSSHLTSHGPVPTFGSNNGGVGVSYNGSNGGGTYNSNGGGKGLGDYLEYYSGKEYTNGLYYFDSNNGGAAPEGNKPGRYYYYGYLDSNNGGKGLGYYFYGDSNNGGIGPKGPAYYYGQGPKGEGYYNYSPDGSGIIPESFTPGPINNPPVVINPPGEPPVVVNPKPRLPQNSSGGSGTTSAGPNNGSNGTGNFSRGANTIIASRGAAISKGIGVAQGKYDAALSALAAAEATTPNTSSKTSPVRYGREPQDVASCGCLNTDTADAASLSKELVAAKAAEAEAAAELASVKAEARKFLESVKAGESASGTYQPIW